MKKYIDPICEINVLETEDVITSSNTQLSTSSTGKGGAFDFDDLMGSGL